MARYAYQGSGWKGNLHLTGGLFIEVTISSKTILSYKGLVSTSRLSPGWNKDRFTRAVNRLTAWAIKETYRVEAAEHLEKRVTHHRNNKAWVYAVSKREARLGHDSDLALMPSEEIEGWLQWLDNWEKNHD